MSNYEKTEIASDANVFAEENCNELEQTENQNSVELDTFSTTNTLRGG